MPEIDGDHALAWGAIEAGVSLVTGYPGSPGTGVFNTLSETADAYGHQTEWCTNEKVALDLAAGISQGGRRVLVCIKSVGMNVASDTLMTLNMTGAPGLVVMIGDDPGAWGSQNEQDSRLLGPWAEVPILEPATPDEGRRMMRWAYDLSEKFNTLVIVRATRSFTQRCQHLPEIEAPAERPARPVDREPLRWISTSINTVENDRRRHLTLKTVEAQFGGCPFNRISGSGTRGILAAGFVDTKLQDAMSGADTSEVCRLKLGTLYPLPKDLIAAFLKRCNEVLVFEEVSPYLEDAVKSIGYDAGATPKVLGKRTGHVNWEGELFRWQIQKSLDAYLPGFTPAKRYIEAEWEKEKPVRKNPCAGCPFEEILATFREEASAVGQNPFIAGDPGCVVAGRRYLDAKHSMGSAISVAAGVKRAGFKQKVVAAFGDSAFYHTGVNALMHARVTETDLLMLLFDNGGSHTTGGQVTPDRGLVRPGGRGPTIGIGEVAAACGVESVWTIEEEEPEERMRAIFREALAQKEGLGLVILRKPCKA